MAIEILSYSLLKDVVLFACRRLRGERPAAREEPARPLVRDLPLSLVARGFEVPLGSRAALVDRDIVQHTFGPGRVRGWQVQRLRRRLSLGADATAFIWNRLRQQVHVYLDGLFSHDSHEFEAELDATFTVDPVVRVGGAIPRTPASPETVPRTIAEVSRPSLARAIGEADGRTLSDDAGLARRLADGLRTELHEVLASDGVTTFSLEFVTIRSPLFERVRRAEAKNALTRAELAVLEERGRVRGALRKQMLAGKLGEIKDRDHFDAAVTTLRQDARLRDLVLRGELQQAELDATLKEIEVWKRRQAAFDETYAWVLEKHGRALESAARFADAMRDRVQGDRSAFTAQERERIARCLDHAAGGAVSPGDVLAAVQRGVEIPVGVFDPFRRVYGVHTLKIGSQWRVFDGDRLWTIRLCGVGTRRHGFLWRKESPASARFEVEGRPGNRVSKKEVSLTQPDSIAVGPHEVRCVFVSGGPYEITVKLGPARVETLHSAGA